MMFGFRELMQETYLAHKIFKDEWEKWERIDKKLKVEPKSVSAARDNFFEKLNTLYGTKLGPLESKFRENPHLAFPELVEFLSIDIAAHRCGYAKEVFLQWLKKVDLSQNEIRKIQEVALKMCETKNVRREFRRWCRLMIKLADEVFFSELKKLVKSDELFTRLKAGWMSELLEKHRTDLRKAIEN